MRVDHTYYDYPHFYYLKNYAFIVLSLDSMKARYSSLVITGLKSLRISFPVSAPLNKRSLL